MQDENDVLWERIAKAAKIGIYIVLLIAAYLFGNYIGDHNAKIEIRNAQKANSNIRLMYEDYEPGEDGALDARNEELNTMIVYWVPSGEVYHKTENCITLSRSKDIRSGTILQSQKQRPCSKCWEI